MPYKTPKTQTLLLALAMFIFAPGLSSAKDYHFLATQDNFFENPANWYPAYPGNQIGAEDNVIIEADAYVEGIRIELEGSMEIALGAEFSGSGVEILVRQTGKLDNYGVIRIDGIRNFGKFANQLSGDVRLKFFSSHPSATTTNMVSATFLTTGDVVNVGTFNNYGYCSVGHDLYNLKSSVFNLIRGAELVVRGSMQNSATATLNNAPESVIQFVQEVNPQLNRETAALND